MNARTTDPVTSHIAGAQLSRAGIEEAILDILLGGSLTSHEISTLTGVPYVTISPRLRPLERRGKIHEAGTRRNRESGKAAIVWALMCVSSPSQQYASVRPIEV